jgi:hypothetical protein
MRASLAFNSIIRSGQKPCAPPASLLTPANMSCNADFLTYLLGTGYARAKRSALECEIERG